MSIVVLVVVALGLINNLDRVANKQLNASFSSAMTTFVLVRGMNAAISVFQGTEVSVEPGGVGVTMTPGQVLDPVNDLVERFSWIVLAAATSLGAQILLLNFGSSIVAKILLLFAGTTILMNVWTSLLDKVSWRHILIKLAVVILLLRFLMPAVVLLNETVYRAFLEPTYTDSYKALEGVAKDVDEFQHQESGPMADDSEESLLTSINRYYERLKQSMNLTEQYQEFSERVSAGADHIVKIIAIYVFQTLLFPLLFLWLAIKIGGQMINADFWLQKRGG
ncbi:hypothetical protein [Thalassotalea mangrovi]|uniref:hypothetical protein n=1 Tax=Thalassotalea mangrovi TaxID=2572245 RepID=UPI00145DA66C|nr:hypothetical protein [Thalassotalea mangrovi]